MILCVNLNPCVDKTLYLDRLTPDVIQTARRVTVTVGGKANNVARVLAAYGRKAVAMNFLGGETGRLCERLLRAEDGLETETVWTAAPTREILTLHEESRRRHTDIKEPSPRITPAEREEFVRRYEARLPRARMVAFGGSSPCPVCDDLPAQLVDIANARGVPFVLDTSGKALAAGIERRPFMVKPNRAEAETLFGRALPALADAIDALDRLSAKAALAVLSLGEEGFLAAYDGRRYRVHAPVVETVNAVGSGDAVVAAALMGLEDRMPFEETLALAAAAGSANAASPLACRICPSDVAPLVSEARVERL